jgi:hypothetical protein
MFKHRSMNLQVLCILLILATSISAQQSESQIFHLSKATIIANDVPMLTRPAAASDVISLLGLGDEFAVLERTQQTVTLEGITGHWFLLTGESTSGWVFGGNLRLAADTESIALSNYEVDENNYLQFPQIMLYQDPGIRIWKLSRRNMDSALASSRYDQLIIHTGDSFRALYSFEDRQRDISYSIRDLKLFIYKTT